MQADLEQRERSGLRALAGRLPPPLYKALQLAWWIVTPHRMAVRRANARAAEARRRPPPATPAPEIAAAPAPVAQAAPAPDPAAPNAQDRVAEMWDQSPQEIMDVHGLYWMAHPQVAARVHTRASGSPNLDAYGHLKRLLESQGWRFPVARILSLGCGHGALERGLAELGVAERIDAIDLAPRAIAEAQRLAAEAGLTQIHYQVGDLEHADLPEGAFDMVFAHQSVHHIEDLDGLFQGVRRALRPGGVLHLHEFVGPDRFQWTDAQLDNINAFVGALPERYRKMPSGELRPPRRRPTIEEMIAADPSEAIRSSAIVEAVRRHFRVIELRELGGSLLHDGLCGIAQNFDPASPEDTAHLQAFFDLEDRLMAEGVVGSDFITVTAARD